ncbi:MAG: helicase-associated domain-containing protein [Zavarzinella sp.]|nr:helicase-associated domain-containing protein [Zavarzinella sp.]
MQSDPADGAAEVRAALARYDESLLRTVTSRLFKPRSHWPVEELIDRAVENLANPPVIDRRLKELPPACRSLLAAIGLSRHYDWPVGQLLALLAAFGHSDGLAPIQALLDSGLAVPVASANGKPLRQWEDWLGATPTAARLFVPGTVAERAAREGAGLPQLPGKRFDPKTIHAADGLEWPLRLGVVWQQLRANPIRLTQANALFKRDLTRLQSDPLLAAPLPDPAVEVPEAGVLALSMGIAAGLFAVRDGTLTAGPFPPAWDAGLVPTITELWAALPDTAHWDPARGYYLTEQGEPFPTVALVALLLLAAQPEGAWTHPLDVAEYLFPKHPSWAAVVADVEAGESWLEAMFLGWALHLRLVEAAQDGEGWWVRLSALGRHLLAGGPAPDLGQPFPRCLVVQPNGDVIAYRQGLTPGLVARLSRFADWKMTGPACTLGLTAESVYRGLESGLTLGDVTAFLQQHSAHAVPANVLDQVRHWAGKRERITVHTAATLLEFNTPADLDAAAARGLVTERLTDRMGLANGEIDYKHFRLLGNRDYEAKPQRCVTFERDGVTFTVDVGASDLLLEAELSRLAQPVPGAGPERRYRITPATAKAVRDQGMTLADLDQWSASRSGGPLSASARLLFAGAAGAVGELRRRLVLTLPSEAVTDGVCQWPETADLLDDRLGPCAVSVPEENAAELLTRLAAVGVEARRE